MNKAILGLLKNLINSLSRARRLQLVLVLILTLFASMLEVVTIASVYPFLNILVSPGQLLENPALRYIFTEILGFADQKYIALAITVIFAGAAMLSGVFRFIVLWLMTRVSFGIGSDLSIQIYDSTLRQDYNFHITTKSSELISAITIKAVQTVQSVIMPLLTLVANTLTLSAVVLLLCFVSPKLAIFSFAAMTIIYTTILVMTRTRMKRDSGIVATGLDEVVRVVQEGLGAIRHIIVDSTQDFYIKFFTSQELRLRRAQGNITIISAGPRYLIEGVVLALVAFSAYFFLKTPGGVASVIPMIGMFMIAFQRTLPLVQASFSSITFIRGGTDSLVDVLDFQDKLNYETESLRQTDELAFSRSIKLKDLSFSYGTNTPEILCHVNMSIKKGSRIGIVGLTGSGKTTLLDIVLGLLSPSAGGIYVDDVLVGPNNIKSWQDKLSHVSQSVFISDGTIAENIALGISSEEIDFARVKEVAKKAMLEEKITSLEFGYETLVGEKGISLSGGQRQRLAIARALYRRCEVLIFDEATSALDKGTELAVIKEIEDSEDSITVIMVAHRISSLENCNQFFKLNQGVLTEELYETINR